MYCVKRYLEASLLARPGNQPKPEQASSQIASNRSAANFQTRDVGALSHTNESKCLYSTDQRCCTTHGTGSLLAQVSPSRFAVRAQNIFFVRSSALVLKAMLGSA